MSNLNIKKRFRGLKKDFRSFNRQPTIGEKIGKTRSKITKKIKKSPRFQKIKKRGIMLRENIDDFFANQRREMRRFEQGKIRF